MCAHLLADVGEERVFFIARPDTLEVRVKSEAVVHIEIHRADDALRQVLQGVNGGVDDGDGEVAVGDSKREGFAWSGHVKLFDQADKGDFSHL